MLSQEKGRYPLCESFSKCGQDFAHDFFFSGFIGGFEMKNLRTLGQFCAICDRRWGKYQYAF